MKFALLEKQLVVDTVLYMPTEFDASTRLSINLVVNKHGAKVSDVSSTSSIEARMETAQGLQAHETMRPIDLGDSPRHGTINGTQQKSPNTLRSSSDSNKFLRMEAHTMLAASGDMSPRTFILDELNDITGLLHDRLHYPDIRY